MTTSRKIVSAAAVVWITVGSTLTLLFSLSIASHLFFLRRYSSPSTTTGWYANLSEVDRRAYEGMTSADVDDLLYWTWTPGWVYEPWTGFREGPRASRFVNVSARGVRATQGGASDLGGLSPERTIYVFGGSTTFGYGVADSETIASYLQANVPDAVFVNLGRGYYYSAQENVLLITLLHSGIDVRRAVFVDGLNERCEFEVYQEEFARLFADVQRARSYDWKWREQLFFPLQWAIGRATARLMPSQDDIARTAARQGPRNDVVCTNSGAPVPLRTVVRANLAIRDAVCNRFGISCLTVLQPLPGVHGKHLNFATLPADIRTQLRAEFDEMKPAFVEARAIDATDVLDGLPDHAFVDNVHYSKAANKEIAGRIAASLLSSAPRPSQSN